LCSRQRILQNIFRCDWNNWKTWRALHVWLIHHFFATRSLLARSFYPCLYNCTRNIFIHAPMISSASFFFNLKHRINHELSFRVVSEEIRVSQKFASSCFHRPSVRPRNGCSVDLTSPVLSFEKIGSIFIITKYIFPSRDDVLFSRDTVRFESGSPRGYDSGVKRRRKRKTRKHVHNATAFVDVH